MKLILTGATGFIGGEVLRQCLQNPAITLITVITRRPLPDEFGSPKLRVILCKEDFEWVEWGPKMMHWVDGSDACIWCIGTSPCSTTPEAYIKTTHTYPLAAATAFSPLASLESKFRFCYLSTWNADLTERRWRPFDKKSSYINGRTEKSLFELTKSHPLQVQWELYTFRPGNVLDYRGEITGRGFRGRVARTIAPTVPVKILAKAMIDVAINGYNDDGVSVFFENREILAKGYEIEEKEMEEQRKKLEKEKAVGEVKVESKPGGTVKARFERWGSGGERVENNS